MNIAQYIDHTILAADSKPEAIERLCSEAREFQFSTVCVPPYYVRKASRLLEETDVRISTVIGFPMGFSTTSAKVEEIKRAINDGVDELDVVINICAVKSKDWNYVKNDIDSVTRTAQLKSKIVKIIFEVNLLTKEEILKLCEICNQVEVDFVKTSTEINDKGPSIELVKLLKEKLNKSIKIKAAGGIKSKAEAEGLLAAGADRLGSSLGITIVSGV